jgi:hypothetical protein
MGDIAWHIELRYSPEHLYWYLGDTTPDEVLGR